MSVADVLSDAGDSIRDYQQTDRGSHEEAPSEIYRVLILMDAVRIGLDALPPSGPSPLANALFAAVRSVDVSVVEHVLASVQGYSLPDESGARIVKGVEPITDSLHPQGL